MITCNSCEEIISAMVDGEASAEQRVMMYDHLVACDRCDAFLTDTITIQVAVAEHGIHILPDQDRLQPPRGVDRKPPPGTAARVRSIIRKQISVPVSVLGGTVIVVGALLYAFVGGPKTPPVEPGFQATRAGLTTVAFPVVSIP